MKNQVCVIPYELPLFISEFCLPYDAATLFSSGDTRITGMDVYSDGSRILSIFFCGSNNNYSSYRYYTAKLPLVKNILGDFGYHTNVYTGYTLKTVPGNGCVFIGVTSFSSKQRTSPVISVGRSKKKIWFCKGEVVDVDACGLLGALSDEFCLKAYQHKIICSKRERTLALFDFLLRNNIQFEIRIYESLLVVEASFLSETSIVFCMENVLFTKA